MAPGSTQRRQRHHQLTGGHAVQRDGVAAPVGDPHPFGELVEIEAVIVQNSLSRAQSVHALRQRRR